MPASFRGNAKGAIETIARVFGLSLIPQALKSFRHITGRGLHEPLKVVLRKNRWTALARSLVHLVPVGFALFEIILNWNEYYVGVNKYNQASYQAVAKLHEIMIQASLGAILFSMIRHEIIVDGLPFGALFSGLQLNQVSYLWSMEYWGSIKSHHLGFRRKLRLSVLIALCVALASLCGPSSAVLLIPRLEFWPAGSTHIWLNATNEQLLPTKVDSSLVPNACYREQEDMTRNDCPWSEWTSIQTYLSATKGAMPDPYRQQYGFTQAPGSVQLNGKSAIRALYNHGLYTWSSQDEYIIVASTQHAAIADALNSAATLWYFAMKNVTARRGHGNPLSEQHDSTHKIEYPQPYIATLCVPDTIDDVNDHRPIKFPLLLNANNRSRNDSIMSWNGPLGYRSVPALTKHDLRRSSLMTPAGNTSEFYLKWIDLPEEEFRGSAIGAIIFEPKRVADHSQPVSVCNVAAGWGRSTLQVQANDYASGGKVSSTPKSVHFSSQYSKFTPAGTGEMGGRVGFEYPDFPQVPITIASTWADLLSSPMRNTSSTIFNQLMQQQLFQGKASTTASVVLSGMIANGLARIGFSSTLQGDLKTKSASKDNSTQIDGDYWLSGKGDVFNVNASEAVDWTKLYMTSTLQGNAYNTIGIPPKTAIAILMVYCMVAICHVVYAGWTGISSSSWDSIAELTALAMNSMPTTYLRNTCGGISEMHIFKLPVRILAAKDEEGEGEHLELVFGEIPDGKECKQSSIEPNRAYGTMTKVNRKQI